MSWSKIRQIIRPAFTSWHKMIGAEPMKPLRLRAMGTPRGVGALRLEVVQDDQPLAEVATIAERRQHQPDEALP